MLSRWLYLLIGDDRTGKTTFQKELIRFLCDKDYTQKVKSDSTYIINHPTLIRGLSTIYIAGRSYQELHSDIKVYMDEFVFKNPADVYVLSSQLNKADIEYMIAESHRRFFNVGGVFWENSVNINPAANRDIAGLDWDERFFVENKQLDCEKYIVVQIQKLARNFARLIAERAEWQ